jgi:hypothetical protein
MHSAQRDPALAEQLAAERKAGGHSAAAQRQAAMHAPVTVKRTRRSTRAERMAGAGNRVEAVASEAASIVRAPWVLAIEAEAHVTTPVEGSPAPQDGGSSE